MFNWIEFDGWIWMLIHACGPKQKEKMVRDFRMKSRARGIFGILLREVSTLKLNWLCDSWYHIAEVAFILLYMGEEWHFPQILGIPIWLQTILVKVDLSLQLMSYHLNYYWLRCSFKCVFAPSQLVSAIWVSILSERLNKQLYIRTSTCSVLVFCSSSSSWCAANYTMMMNSRPFKEVWVPDRSWRTILRNTILMQQDYTFQVQVKTQKTTTYSNV